MIGPLASQGARNHPKQMFNPLSVGELVCQTCFHVHPLLRAGYAEMPSFDGCVGRVAFTWAMIAPAISASIEPISVPGANSGDPSTQVQQATEPEVILMDEPCSALDPISTLKIEETMHELKRSYTIVIVTHNMQQAVRVADMTAFYNAEAVDGGSGKVGYLVEFDRTESIFNSPTQQATLDYVSGRFG